MRTVLYRTREERTAAIDLAEAQGETMLRDDFNVGPDGENRLEFDVLPIAQESVDEERLAILQASLVDTGVLSAVEVLEYLRLKERQSR